MLIHQPTHPPTYLLLPHLCRLLGRHSRLGASSQLPTQWEFLEKNQICSRKARICSRQLGKTQETVMESWAQPSNHVHSMFSLHLFALNPLACHHWCYTRSKWMSSTRTANHSTMTACLTSDDGRSDIGGHRPSLSCKRRPPAHPRWPDLVVGAGVPRNYRRS